MGKKRGVLVAVRPGERAQDAVRRMMKKGKLKKKCCRSKSRCKKCPVLALKAAKAELAKTA